MKEKVLEKLREMVNHKLVKLTSNGDSSIFIALMIAKNMGKTKVLIPDQGGWLSYPKLPKLLDLEVEEYSTKLGIIEIADIRKKLDKNTIIMITQPAGYSGVQDVKLVYSLCKQAGSMLILDITGSIGNKKQVDGRYADIIVSSFGKDKPVNLGYGGMISTDNKKFFEKKEMFEITEFCSDKLSELMERLDELPFRLKYLYERAEEIKDDLSDFEIIHKDSQGINVIVKGKEDKVIKYCEENDLEYTICPREIRVNVPAISIEVKRLK